MSNIVRREKAKKQANKTSLLSRLNKHFTKRKKDPNFILSVIVTTVRMFIIFFIILGFAGFGAVLGVAKAFVDGTPTLDVRRIETQNLTSFIYDMNGDLITEYKGLEHRVWASIDEIPKQLQDAFIATEDIRFEAHNGLDYKRLAGAFINNLMSEGVQGGSTITQQLIKNTLLSPEQTYKRKLQEAYLAIQLENEYSKDEILEAYLNTIYLGSGNYGVKTAAMNYFGKELKDLNLRECAILAGITKNPYQYDPRLNIYSRDRADVTYRRGNLVLRLMYENSLISKMEYEAALFDVEGGPKNEGFVVIEESSHQKLYDMPYFIEYVVEDVIEALMKQNNWQGDEGRRRANDLIQNGGLHIYTTVDPKIQEILEESIYNWKSYPETRYNKDKYSKEVVGNRIVEVEQPQAAAVVLDHHTGELRALVGGRTEPTARFLLNRVNRSFPVGSAIKPISVYAPFIEAGYPNGIIIEDIPAPIKGWDDGEGGKGHPKNYTAGRFYGPVPFRKAVVSSYNVSSARTLLERVGPEYSMNKLRELGITEKRYVETPLPSNLSLGGDPMNMIETAGAFGTLANKGEYRQPISFTKVLDKDGNVILSNDNQRKLTVFKESTAFIITDILQEVVSTSAGTGRRAAFPNMHIAGKTGTNDSERGVFFAGYTPYYTAVLGIAHDKQNIPLASNSTGGRSAAPLWKDFMEKIHKDLPDKPFFESVPSNVKKVEVCALSGKLPNERCASTISEYFPESAIPTQECDMHTELAICKYSGKLPSPYCPDHALLKRSVAIIPEGSPYELLTDKELASLYNNNLLKGAIRSTRGSEDPDTDQNDLEEPAHNADICHLHNEEWYLSQGERSELKNQADNLINQISYNMELHRNRLTDADRSRLNAAIDQLRNVTKDNEIQPPGEGEPYLDKLPPFDPNEIRQAMQNLRDVYDTVLDNINSN